MIEGFNNMQQDDYLQNSYINFPKVLSGSMLKLIAILSMLTDHFAAVILTAYYSYATNTAEISKIYSFMRGIGRIAFPLFCFLAVEGFTYSKNRFKYLSRLFLFALISEIPFDIAFSKIWFDFTQQNVMFTILFGILGIWLYEYIWQMTEKKNIIFILRHIFSILPLFVLGYSAHILHTDYAAIGVLTIGVMYLHKDYRIFAFLGGIAVLCLGYGSIEFPAFLAGIPVLFYSGKRGFGLKYFFYIFYPAHLLVLAYLSLHLDYFLAPISG